MINNKMSTINVVVSRYQRNTDFVNKLHEVAPVKVLIYDKGEGNSEYYVPVNRGREASVYLKYIIDHYTTLPEYTFFIHDEERSWHHDGTIAERFKEALDSKRRFYNINNQHFNGLHNIDSEKRNDLINNWYPRYVEKYIPYSSLPDPDFLAGDKYKFAAQFLVHKDLILSLPLEFYEGLYSFCMETTDEKMSGYYLEWTWHVFWEINKN